ncbi:hypothetical protein A5883_003102 [Enterococcus sp. 5B3_DIV0040]|nr:hypothetical protein A5883_003102 [Enterococcus sp. 5B3_DIV0040]
MYSYKIPISKTALREKYDTFLLKNYLLFQKHGYSYHSYDRMDYNLKLSLRDMTLTITRKDSAALSAKERAFFAQMLPDFFEKLEIEFIQEKEMMEEYDLQ